MEKSMTIAVDVAKDVLEVALADGKGRIVERGRLARAQFLRFFDNRPPCRVVMEACWSAQHWARILVRLGFSLRLLPPQYVRPYRRRNKTDRSDCEALLEAARNGEIRAVAVKTVEQQTIQQLHRVRSQWLRTRTARINGLRGMLRVRGMSMRGVGILDGDLLAVHRARQASNGDIVVARVNDEEVTVKRWHRRSAYLIRLLPENPDFDPIELDLRNDTLVIEGLGVGVLRLQP